MKNTIKTMFILSSSILLLGCGGGGGSENTSTSAAAVNNTAKYVGIWNSSCTLDISIKINGVSAYVVRTLEFTTNSATTLSGQFKMKTYSASDTTCKLPSLGSMDRSLVVTLAGVGTGAGGSDKVDLVMQSYAISGETVTITQSGSSVSYANGLTKGGSYKDILLLSNNTLRWGDNSGTATSYPNALSTDPTGVFTKQ